MIACLFFKNHALVSSPMRLRSTIITCVSPMIILRPTSFFLEVASNLALAASSASMQSFSVEWSHLDSTSLEGYP
jgi:hypothetical protein